MRHFFTLFSLIIFNYFFFAQDNEDIGCIDVSSLNYIEENAICWAVAKVSAKRIDKINILNASIEAMHKAIEKINHKIDLLIIDGNKFKQYKNINHICVIKGDSQYASIASASILAKTHRDNYMKKLNKQEPLFNWERNKGYPTKEHKIKIKNHGLSKSHRKTFKSN